RSGELVNAVYGFASMLFKIFSDLQPDYLAVVFDTPGPTARHQEYIGYKANRPAADSELVGQIERVHELVKAFNIPVLELQGYEADDIIATVAKQVTRKTLSTKKTKGLRGKESKLPPDFLSSQDPEVEVVVVTGDKDLMQLVDEKVKLYMPGRGLSDGQFVGVEEVKKRMGVLPEQIVDYKGLVGDPSDNYPGVPGIGPKTAVELLKKFGGIEEIYRKLGDVKDVKEIGGENTLKKLAEGAESAVLSKKLATISTEVPIKLKLKDCVARDFDKEKVLALFRQLGFRSLAGRLTGEGKKKESKGRPVEGDRQQSLF
ncbi:MAG: 5'-3' exonuclease, partial [Microgenomates group bacterium]